MPRYKSCSGVLIKKSMELVKKYFGAQEETLFVFVQSHFCKTRWKRHDQTLYYLRHRERYLFGVTPLYSRNFL